MFYCFHSYILSLSLMTILYALFVAFICSVISSFLQPHGLQHSRLPCPSPSPGICLNLRPYHPLSLPFPLAFTLFHHQGLFQWVGSSHQVAKVLELQHQSLQWIQSWLPLGLTGLHLSPSLLQHHTSKALILWSSVFFMVHRSHLDVTTGKTIALTVQTFVSKMTSLLFIFYFFIFRLCFLIPCLGWW